MRFIMVNAEPGKWAKRLLPFSLVMVVILSYSLTAHMRHYGIPDSVSEMRKELVFSMSGLDESDSEELNGGNIPEKIQIGFEGGGKSLAKESTVSIREKGRRWRIVDDASKKTYTVAEENRMLNVYENRAPYFLAKKVGNPKDKIVPTLGKLKDGFNRTAFEKDRKGDYRLWKDTLASSRRFLIGVAIVFLGAIVGLHMGTSPYVECMLYRFVLFTDKIPAMAILPILLIVFGIGEVTKIALIAIGVMPTLILDTYLSAKAVPREQITKAMTLKASSLEIIYRIVLPQIFPKALDTMRLNFKAIIFFLIAGEALASKEGLGYRIFLVRRYMAMDIIIPYVLWISLLAFLADLAVRVYIKKRYPWLNK